MHSGILETASTLISVLSVVYLGPGYMIIPSSCKTAIQARPQLMPTPPGSPQNARCLGTCDTVMESGAQTVAYLQVCRENRERNWLRRGKYTSRLFGEPFGFASTLIHLILWWPLMRCVIGIAG